MLPGLGSQHAHWQLLTTPPGTQVPVGSHHTDPKVVQRVVLAAKQLLIEYGPLDAGEEFPPSTIEAQRDMRKLFNGWIDAHNVQESSGTGTSSPPPPPAPSRVVQNVSIFNRPAMLLEFDSPKSKSLFSDLCDKNPTLLNEISQKARICP